MAKPNQLTYLRPGKAIGAHRGFAETFNWIVRFCANLTGDGITAKVDRLNQGDNPVVRCIGMIGDGGSGEATSLTGNETGSDAASGALTIYSASDSNVKVTTDNTNKTVTIGVYYT